LEEFVREVLSQCAGLDAMYLDADTNLFAAGMTSHASVNVMMRIEETLDVEFPDSLMKKATFTSISSIVDAVHSLNSTPS
jgi:acyl carrier protein